LEFGCQKTLHTKTYNIHGSEICFVDDRGYNIVPERIYGKFKKILNRKKGELKK